VNPYRTSAVLPALPLPPFLRRVRDVVAGDIVRVIRVRHPLSPEARMLGRTGIVTAISHGIAHVRFAGHVEGFRFLRHELARVA